MVLSVSPTIVPFSFGDVASNPGDTVQLTCLVTKGDSPLEINWYFQGSHSNQIERDVTITKLSDRGSILMVSSLRPEHRGNYTCHVQNAAGEASFSTTLVVNGRCFSNRMSFFNSNTIFFFLLLTDLFLLIFRIFLFFYHFSFILVLPRIEPVHIANRIRAGETAQITCLVSQGDSPIDISWSFQGSELSNQKGIYTSKIGKKLSVLMIDPITSLHTGNYTCTVRNPAGTVNYTTSLNVFGIPQKNNLYYEVKSQHIDHVMILTIYNA